MPSYTRKTFAKSNDLPVHVPRPSDVVSNQLRELQAIQQQFAEGLVETVEQFNTALSALQQRLWALEAHAFGNARHELDASVRPSNADGGPIAS